MSAENVDPEIQAMQAIAEALETLDAPTAARVLGWAEARFGIEAQQLAVARLNETLMASLAKTAQTLGAVDYAARDYKMDSTHLRVALQRLYEEAKNDG